MYDNDALCSGTKMSNPFTVTHTNGIHRTRLCFCGCLGALDKVTQLMQARVFPSTPSDSPKSAHTFAVLKHYHMQICNQNAGLLITF